MTATGHSYRFGGIERLYGKSVLARLRSSHVCIIGIGGVGSWTVEALVRSGIGEVTFVDLDDVCISNVNRQLHAVDGEFGKPKVEVMAKRVRAINPECKIHPSHAFFTPNTADALLSSTYDVVVDAIDRPSLKCLLIAKSKERNLPIVTTGGAGGRRDPTAVQVADLAHTFRDDLLQEVRRGLRRHFGFPRQPHPFGVDAVFSPEPRVFPAPDGTVCSQKPTSADLRLDCTTGYGTASFVTGTFGLTAAAVVVRKIAQSLLELSK
jgi:tRNA A37 threonylcarbamoyladenosine dehydratase